MVEFNCGAIAESLIQTYGSDALKQFIDDKKLAAKLSAYPPEVSAGIESRKLWVQLNPKNTFVAQDSKEEWVKYAAPFICSCLKTLAKKALISDYEDSRLRNGSRGFVLATYGDSKNDVLPTREDLMAIATMMQSALTGSSLAVGNNWLDAKFVEADMRDLFEFDIYGNVNKALLSAGGLSSIVVTGDGGTGSSFATASLNVQTAALRIKNAKDNFARMMNKVNARLNGHRGAMPYAAADRVPEFTFAPTDLQGNKAFQETCMKLWKEGVLSHQTMLDAYGMDLKQEVERRKTEMEAGYDDVFVPPAQRVEQTQEAEQQADEPVQGRPKLDETERNSDEANSITGRQPKPSNPEGSEAQE